MENMPYESRLDIRLVGHQRELFERALLPVAQWKSHPEMPPECWNVVTGDAFYCGCEGIGRTEENGWFLVLWAPSDDVPHDQAPQKLGDSGLVITGAQIVGGPSARDEGELMLMFMERGSISVPTRSQQAATAPEQTQTTEKDQKGDLNT
jgi:hypothetical protein